VSLEFLMVRFDQWRDQEALVLRGRSCTYGWLSSAVKRAEQQLLLASVPEGAVTAIEADFTPEAIAMLLALVRHRAIVVPMTQSVESKKFEFREIAEVEWIVVIAPEGNVRLDPTGKSAIHPMLLDLKDKLHPGLVLFSSGSTGKSKAALHDFDTLLEKFRELRPAARTLAFLLFDHIGGLNTLLHTLSTGGTLITVEDRGADEVCETIAANQVEILPTSPTFLNLLIFSEALNRHDLSSLRLITYGTEPMPEHTLAKIHALLPDVRLLQTYGLTEVGILRSKSRSSDSLWVKIGGEGFDTRVRDGLLEIKAHSAMRGYLNAPSPFSADGWFMTGDAVEVDGEYFRILGRATEMINVGGQKVYPAQVESALLSMDGVEDALVLGKANAITGQMVSAVVLLSTGEDLPSFRKRMRAFLAGRMPAWMVPQHVVFAEQSLHGARFKKLRKEWQDA
jgi:long-chain acyl-CoA synthetase